MLPGLTKEMYMYVNGKKLALDGEELYRGLVPTPALTPYTYPHPYTYSYTFKMPSDRPLSIMVFGYLKAECPQPILPIDISKDVIAANGEKDALLRLLRGLTENIESPCGVDTGDDPNDPHDNTPIRRHVFLGYINEVYQPPSYDAGPHVENSKINALSQSIVPDPNFRLKYSIKVTPPVNTDVVQKQAGSDIN